MPEPLLVVEGLTKSYTRHPGFLRPAPRFVRPALDGVSISLDRGSVLGIVGESGSGKSTLARCLTLLERPDSGRVTFDGVDLTALDGRALRATRRYIQIVFQDPYSSLNPRMSVGDALREVLSVHRSIPRAGISQRVAELLEMVGLARDVVDRYPSGFSGGQRQRICIARSLAAEPKLLIADEAVSALDVSIQAQILNLLTDLQRDLGLTLIFISHNLYVVRHIAQRVGVMFAGRLIETLPSSVPLDDAQHPYTQTLLAAVPRVDRQIDTSERQDADLAPGIPATGCPYRERCRHAFDLCRQKDPPLYEIVGGHRSACHLVTHSETRSHA